MQELIQHDRTLQYSVIKKNSERSEKFISREIWTLNDIFLVLSEFHTDIIIYTVLYIYTVYIFTIKCSFSFIPRKFYMTLRNMLIIASYSFGQLSQPLHLCASRLKSETDSS